MNRGIVLARFDSAVSLIHHMYAEVSMNQMTTLGAATNSTSAECPHGTLTCEACLR